jgi:hypothetical protein
MKIGASPIEMEVLIESLKFFPALDWGTIPSP